MWTVRHRDGTHSQFREMTTLQKWVVEQKVERADEVSSDGQHWRTLDAVEELTPFFTIVDAARSAAGTSQPPAPAEAQPPPASPHLEAPVPSSPGASTSAAATPAATTPAASEPAASEPAEAGPAVSAELSPAEETGMSTALHRAFDAAFVSSAKAPASRGGALAQEDVESPAPAVDPGRAAPDPDVSAAPTVAEPEPELSVASRAAVAFWGTESSSGPAASLQRPPAAAGHAEEDTTGYGEAADDEGSGADEDPLLAWQRRARTRRYILRAAAIGLALGGTWGYLQSSAAGPASLGDASREVASLGDASREVASLGDASREVASLGDASSGVPVGDAGVASARRQATGAGAHGAAQAREAAQASARGLAPAAVAPREAPASSGSASSGSASSGSAPPMPASTAAAAPGVRDDQVAEWVRQADRLRQSDRTLEALALYERALEARPADTAARTGLGWSYIDLERYREARRTFETILRDHADDALAHFGLAEAARFAGDGAAARRHYQRYLALQPNGSEARAARLALDALPSPPP